MFQGALTGHFFETVVWDKILCLVVSGLCYFKTIFYWYYNILSYPVSSLPYLRKLICAITPHFARGKLWIAMKKTFNASFESHCCIIWPQTLDYKRKTPKSTNLFIEACYKWWENYFCIIGYFFMITKVHIVVIFLVVSVGWFLLMKRNNLNYLLKRLILLCESYTDENRK